MKKGGIIIGVIIIALVVGTFLYTFQKEFSEDELIEIVSPEINNYCNNLPIQEGLDCPTCSNRGVEYSFSVENGNFLVNAKVNLIFGGRNDQPGFDNLTFLINKQGEILEKIIPSTECV